MFFYLVPETLSVVVPVAQRSLCQRIINIMLVQKVSDVRFHFIHWVIKDSKFQLIYCPMSDMIANPLTKGLPSPKLMHFAVELGLRDA